LNCSNNNEKNTAAMVQASKKMKPLFPLSILCVHVDLGLVAQLLRQLTGELLMMAFYRKYRSLKIESIIRFDLGDYYA
jgi:hypothetical protein